MSNLIELINSELPQFQCGRCDTPGCRPYAEEIAKGSPHNRCVPGGQKTLDKISILLNDNTLSLDHDYGPELKPQVANIIEDDCIGCTKCIDACPVDAISGAPNLMHNVINDLCTGCELCIEPCLRVRLMSWLPRHYQYGFLQNSKQTSHQLLAYR